MIKDFGTLLLLFLLSCTKSPSVDRLTLTFSGPYASTTDDENPLNCFCTGGGYIEACGAGPLPLCFSGERPPGNCHNLEIWGRFIYAEAALAAGTPCPQEPFRYFLVTRWTCHENEMRP